MRVTPTTRPALVRRGLGTALWHTPMGRRRFRVLALAGLALAGSASSARGQVEQLIGQPVTAIRLQIEGQPASEPDLLSLLETRVGEPLSLVDVRESILHFYSLGRFENVVTSASLESGGLVLVYDLLPLHRVDKVDFEGTLGLSQGRLRAAVEERYGEAPSAGVAQEAEQTLRDELELFGYLDADVRSRVDVDHRRERSTLVFVIGAGPRSRVGDIEVRGAPQVSTAELLDRLDIATGDPYDRRKLDERLARFVEDLRGRGYYEAVATAAATPTAGAVDLAIDVQSGPRVSLRFEGDSLPENRREDLVPIRREASVHEDLLEDSARAIQQFFRAQGYWQAEASFRREPAPGGEVRIVFSVTRGRLARVASVEMIGSRTVPDTELRPLIGLGPGDLYVQANLDASVSRVRNAYQQRGYPNVALASEAVETASGTGADPALLDVRIAVDEGERIVVGGVRFSGETALEEAGLRAVLETAAGQPYDARRVDADREALRARYLDAGYLSATVGVRTGAPADGLVDVTFDVAPGRQVLVDHLIVIGNTHTSSQTIRREIVLEPGRPLGFSAMIESQRRLQAMGLFRRVRISDLRDSQPGRRDVLVSVEEAPRTTIGYGAGVEVSNRLVRAIDATAKERIEVAPRGFFEVGRRNLWGKNRSLDLFTRFSLRPRDPVDSRGGLRLSEYRFLFTYREPRAFNWAADAFVRAVVEQAVRSSFSYSRRGVQAQLVRRFGERMSLSGNYTFDRTRLFDEKYSPEDKLLIDRLFPRVRLSYAALALLHDTRDDQLDPARGAIFGVETELAARVIGSQVGYGKTFAQAFVYRALPWSRRLVLASGARLGIARGFPRTVPVTDEGGQPVLGPDGQPLEETVEEIPASQRFFAGGGTTVRGFALDRLGDDPTIDPDGFPKGGNAVVIFNAEVRVPVWRTLGAVAFVDVGNVFARVQDIDFGQLRGSVGFGIRYNSPVGPLRVDLGFKLDRRTFANGGRERGNALHFSIGQAF